MLDQSDYIICCLKLGFLRIKSVWFFSCVSLIKMFDYLSQNRGKGMQFRKDGVWIVWFLVDRVFVIFIFVFKVKYLQIDFFK